MRVGVQRNLLRDHSLAVSILTPSFIVGNGSCVRGIATAGWFGCYSVSTEGLIEAAYRGTLADPLSMVVGCSQNPYWLQQTLRGHPSFFDHSSPQPGSQFDFASQVPVQLPCPQYAGPNPQNPHPEQHPVRHGWLSLHVWEFTSTESKRPMQKESNESRGVIVISLPDDEKKQTNVVRGAVVVCTKPKL